MRPVLWVITPLMLATAGADGLAGQDAAVRQRRKASPSTSTTWWPAG
jgi:hypothetical protein